MLQSPVAGATSKAVAQHRRPLWKFCVKCRDPWKAWQQDMTELINLRLARYAAQSFWRSSTATHFGGVNGTMTFDKDACKALADSGVCPPSPLNESWYASAWCHPKPC